MLCGLVITVAQVDLVFCVNHLSNSDLHDNLGNLAVKLNQAHFLRGIFIAFIICAH